MFEHTLASIAGIDARLLHDADLRRLLGIFQREFRNGQQRLSTPDVIDFLLSKIIAHLSQRIQDLEQARLLVSGILNGSGPADGDDDGQPLAV